MPKYILSAVVDKFITDLWVPGETPVESIKNKVNNILRHHKITETSLKIDNGNEVFWSYEDLMRHYFYDSPSCQSNLNLSDAFFSTNDNTHDPFNFFQSNNNNSNHLGNQSPLINSNNLDPFLNVDEENPWASMNSNSSGNQPVQSTTSPSNFSTSNNHINITMTTVVDGSTTATPTSTMNDTGFQTKNPKKRKSSADSVTTNRRKKSRKNNYTFFPSTSAKPIGPLDRDILRLLNSKNTSDLRCQEILAYIQKQDPTQCPYSIKSNIIKKTISLSLYKLRDMNFINVSDDCNEYNARFHITDLGKNLISKQLDVGILRLLNSKVIIQRF